MNDLDQVPQVLASGALVRALGPAYWAFDGVYVKLRPGTSMPAFSASAQALAQRYPATGKQVYVADQSVQYRRRPSSGRSGRRRSPSRCSPGRSR